MKVNYRIQPISVLIGFLCLLAVGIGLFYVAKGIYTILYWIAPIMLLGILILDYRVILRYGSWLIAKYQVNLIAGISWTLITVFGFPIVLAILLGRSILQYQVRRITKEKEQQQMGEYITYEEINEETYIE